VHAYLAEFELALKALDAYLELFSRGKTRAEKSNEPDFSLDDHDKVLWILSEAISILCRFGRREEAEKAMELATKLRAWTEQWVAEPQIQETSTAPFNGNAEALSKPVSPTIVAIAYHALGTAEAHWARLTYEAATRTQHQNKAQEYFRLALHRRYRSSKNLDYIYSLAILMAEMRDIPGAIKIVKQALAEGDQQQTSDAEGLAQERKLIRFWHLLTLLLSARSDLLNAAKASNAAFEQFQDPGVLFGSQEYRSEHLNDASEKLRDMSPALIDQMNAFEKAGVLQVKMTQVALLEALEGPTSAIEASLDLLAIYARLFGEARDSDAPQTSATTKAPKSRVGSLRASIYKRVRSRKGDNPSLSIDVPQTATTRPQTGATLAVAPSIQVTDTSSAVGARGRTSNGSSSRRQHSLKGVRSADDNHVAQRSRSRGKIRKRSSSRKSLESFRPTSPATTYDESQAENSPSKEISEKENIRHSVYSTKAPSTAGSTMTRSTNTALPNHGNKRDSRASMDTIISHDGTVLIRQGSPAPSFPNITARRHKLSVLVDLWLFVAGMYTRSELFEDAAEAVNEAAYLVSSFEMEISRLNASAKAYSDPAWGGGKSVDELWGDIWAQVCYLLDTSS
jgi:tetratricopeptide (TPR) repeat protein